MSTKIKTFETVECTKSSLEDYIGKKIDEWTVEDFVGFKRVVYDDAWYLVLSMMWIAQRNRLIFAVQPTDIKTETLEFEVKFDKEIGRGMPLLRRGLQEIYTTGYGLAFLVEAETENLTKTVDTTAVTVEGLEKYFGKMLENIEVYDILGHFSNICVGSIAHKILGIKFNKKSHILKVVCNEKEFELDLNQKNAAIWLF